MNLPDEYCNDNSKFLILPIEYEGTLTYGKGASKGPEEIIKASQHLDYYEDQFENEPFVKGIKLLDAIKPKNEEEMLQKTSETVEKHKDKFIIGLGGDHSVTIGIINGLEKDNDFSVIVLDAHNDFSDSWNNSKNNHACVSKRISNKHDLAIIGVRSQDIEEHKEIKNSDNIHQISAYDLTLEKIKEILPKLKERVYISIDVDVFDPSFIRNTGTPEPGGLDWNIIIDILKLIFKEKEVIGADIVEFAPKENFRAEAYSLARLAYKIMSLNLI
ncbi:agmatinase [Candidatus Woesearchaeota archaeon]|nr:agmatinase [Candidatus Woesearchaeota archaeon]MBT6044964.1 agmatinase [Candidatus Woesearchaeota archaeon]